MKTAIKTECHCKRCGYNWEPKVDTKPVSCPNCKSYKWDKVKK